MLTNDVNCKFKKWPFLYEFFKNFEIETGQHPKINDEILRSNKL